PVDPVTGMLINISEMKERAGKIVRERFDHKFLNEDNPAFGNVPPTVDNIARQLYVDVAPLFSHVDAKLVACHLTESPSRSATYYSDGACEGNHWFEFSAARQTRSPRLSRAANKRLFGNADAIHGHNYRARLTFRTESVLRKAPLVRYDDVDHCVKSLHAELDHRHLNKEVATMKDSQMTMESLAGYIYELVNELLLRHCVRLLEQDDFFAEIWDDESVFLGMQMPF